MTYDLQFNLFHLFEEDCSNYTQMRCHSMRRWSSAIAYDSAAIRTKKGHTNKRPNVIQLDANRKALIANLVSYKGKSGRWDVCASRWSARRVRLWIDDIVRTNQTIQDIANDRLCLSNHLKVSEVKWTRCVNSSILMRTNRGGYNEWANVNSTLYDHADDIDPNYPRVANHCKKTWTMWINVHTGRFTDEAQFEMIWKLRRY